MLSDLRDEVSRLLLTCKGRLVKPVMTHEAIYDADDMDQGQLATRPKTDRLWRAQAQLVIAERDAAQVIIPAMEGNEHRPVPWDVVPRGTGLGERFYLRCSLDPDNFQVAPE